jgi:hypothetical protein
MDARPNTRRVVRAILPGLVVAGACLFWSTPGWAHPSYPPAIESEFKLSYIPTCCLCHVTSDCASNTGAELDNFGTVLLQFGLNSIQTQIDPGPGSLLGALANLKEQDAALYGEIDDDLQMGAMGVYPDADPATNAAMIAELKANGLPQPQFGCGQLAPGRAAPKEMWVPALVCALIASRRRAKRGRQDTRDHRGRLQSRGHASSGI